jgi:hypothetical protein
MTKSEKHDDPEHAAEELEKESARQGERAKKAEEPPFTTRHAHMHDEEDPETEHEGKKTSQDYA